MNTLAALLPETVLGLTALLVLWRPTSSNRWWLVGAFAVALGWELIGGARVSVLFHGGFTQDRFALYAKLIVLLVGLLSVLTQRAARPFEPLIALGGLVAASSTSLLGIVAGAELATLAGVLAMPRGASARRTLMFQLIAAGLILTGLAQLMAVGGSTYLSALRTGLGDHTLTGAIALAVLLVLAPSLARLGVATAQGATVTASAGIVAVKYAALLSSAAISWSLWLSVAAAVVMVAGALGTVLPGPLHRTLQFAALAQFGWLLAALTVPDRGGLAAALFVLPALCLALVAVHAMRGQLPSGATDSLGRPRTRRHLWVLAPALLSLAGAVPLVGGFSEFAVAATLGRGGFYWLLLVALASAAVTIWAAIRVLARVLGRPASETATDGEDGIGHTAATGLFAAASLLLGFSIFAYPVTDLASQGAAAIALR